MESNGNDRPYLMFAITIHRMWTSIQTNESSFVFIYNEHLTISLWHFEWSIWTKSKLLLHSFLMVNFFEIILLQKFIENVGSFVN